MYAATYRTDDQLAAQNTQQGWIDCTYRFHPRPHRFEPTAVPGYHRCTRCPVMTRSAGIPDPWLHRRAQARSERLARVARSHKEATA